MTPDDRQDVIDAYHRLYYDEARLRRTWWATRWLGSTVYKSPADLMLYGDVIWRTRPQVIIETGTAEGGSALFYASLLDIIGRGTVITIDVLAPDQRWPAHKRIRYVQANSATWEPPSGLAGPMMVVLDSDHAQTHVAAELERLAPYVTQGQYLVVEDTNVGGHPVNVEHGPGPREALDEWLPRHPEFAVDQELADRHLFSMHTWLRRIR